MNHRKRAIVVFVIAAIIVVLPALLVIYVDPFQIYHKPRIAGMALQENQRYQNAGLVNSYLADTGEAYDSVMIGTSMSQNFTGAMVSKTLSWQKPLRLFMPGALAEEQLAVLQHALDTGRVKHILLELHPFLYQDSYRQKKQLAADKTLYFPRFLYNDTVLDDAPYIFNIDVLKMSWRLLTQAPAAQSSTTKLFNPETLGYWGRDENVHSDHLAFNAAENIAKIKQQTAGFSVKAKSDDEIRAWDYPILSDSLLPLLSIYCNSDIDIVMYVPPWPRFRYQKSDKVTLRSLYMMRRLLEKTADCGNIHLYNFDLLDFTGNLVYYKDEQHYLPEINQRILDHIARGEHRLTRDNIAQFENNFIEGLNRYVVYSSSVNGGKVP